MAKTVILDGMIHRADFAQQEESTSIDLFERITIGQIDSNSPILKLLRKPDFQRETNHWTPVQVATFLSSFASGELIPSLILWKSSSFVFVIDGGHRLSALRAWVENDYGDGAISHSFYSGEIPVDQKKLAKRTRSEVEKRVGRYSDFLKAAQSDGKGIDQDLYKKASTVFTKAIPIQWIQGSQEVAESSFFKINSQGTALDKTEELLLKNRRKSFAIGARSVVRSGTGHKYWSGFDDSVKNEIETLASELYHLLFQPDVTEPIKTLDLPLGGVNSPVEALKMLIDTFALCEVSGVTPEKAIQALNDDIDGSETVKILKTARKVVRRIAGNSPPSLGLHPAVYFYNEKGRQSRFLFLGTVKIFAAMVRTNNDNFFRVFTHGRGKLEQILIKRKAVINQALANVNSTQRINRVADLLEKLTDDIKNKEKVSDERILSHLGLQGKIAKLKLIDHPSDFSVDTKSAVYLAESLKNAPKCPLCAGLLDTQKSASYDHVEAKNAGGRGSVENCQLTHPYCNSIKN
ncbi:HNH endonuclease family protein [Haloferula sp.]|uniref:HNH endonuclease family protein n=1 Tax=Haloferula sp. TaxID=2497595 RepID=UPI003C77A7FF